MSKTAASTSNYALFHFLPHNRVVDPASRKYREIRDSIKVNGQIVPIVCDLVGGLMYVSEGQHRFVACKELGLPISYNIVDGSSKLVAEINTVRSSWTTDNYIESHKNDNPSYRFFKELHAESELSYSALHNALFNRTLHQKEFHRGTMQLSLRDANSFRRDVLNKLLQLINVNEGELRADLTGAKAIGVLAQLIRQPGYDHDHMLDRMTNRSSIRTMTTRADAYDFLVGVVYNKRLSRNKQVEFQFDVAVEATI